MDMNGSLRGDLHGAALSCHGICYDVTLAKPCFKPPQSKRILKNVNALFKGGMNAILGPTGSGKSSLLDVLAGRKDPRGLSGTLLIDGRPPPENFKCMVGYVVQDDVVMGTLTVKENLQFSAALRLPPEVTSKERDDLVDQVIMELGLSKCANTRVGTEFTRGVSGGERKRCNIGMELIIQPPVLFLDEPTTGLDASTANAVMMLLHRLSRKGRTIVFSIHQPRYSIYRLFDSLILLTNGETVFHGATQDALPFFEDAGYICESYNNPPDFFLDVINGDSTAVAAINQETKKTQENGHHTPCKEENEKNGTAKLMDSQAEGLEPNTAIEMEEINNVDSNSISEKYRASALHTRLIAELGPIFKEYEEKTRDGTIVYIKKVEYASTFRKQFAVLSRRAVMNLVRNPEAFVLQIAIMIIFALIVGTVYFQISSSKKDGIQNRTGAFFFIVVNQVFESYTAVELFFKERAIFCHENVSGFYRVSAYFLAKLTCDIIPMRLLPTSLFCVIGYFMMGMRAGVDHFFFFLLMLFTTTLAASGTGFMLGASVQQFSIANLLLALIYVFQMLFSGLLVNLGTMSNWLSWVQYLSIFRYALNGLYVNEMKDDVYYNYNATDFTLLNDYLEDQEIPYETTWDLWVNPFALVAMAVFFYTLTYVQLRRFNKMR